MHSVMGRPSSRSRYGFHPVVCPSVRSIPAADSEKNAKLKTDVKVTDLKSWTSFEVRGQGHRVNIPLSAMCVRACVIVANKSLVAMLLSPA